MERNWDAIASQFVIIYYNFPRAFFSHLKQEIALAISALNGWKIPTQPSRRKPQYVSTFLLAETHARCQRLAPWWNAISIRVEGRTHDSATAITNRHKLGVFLPVTSSIIGQPRFGRAADLWLYTGWTPVRVFPSRWAHARLPGAGWSISGTRDSAYPGATCLSGWMRERSHWWDAIPIDLGRPLNVYTA